VLDGMRRWRSRTYRQAGAPLIRRLRRHLLPQGACCV